MKKLKLLLGFLILTGIGIISCKKESNKNDGVLGTSVGGSQKIYGCTDPTANNYNSAANTDDGSCTYDPPCKINNTGEYHFVSTFNDTYTLYINNIIVGTLAPGSSSSPSTSSIYTVAAGTIYAKAVPTKLWYVTKTKTTTVAQCSTGQFFTW